MSEFTLTLEMHNPLEPAQLLESFSLDLVVRTINSVLVNPQVEESTVFIHYIGQPEQEIIFETTC